MCASATSRAATCGLPDLIGQNARHERMHLTLKEATTAGEELPAPQASFDRFIECSNQERPREALHTLDA